MLIQTTMQVEVDTDSFTPAQWKEFILQYLTPQEIQRTIKTDMFPAERLKARALIAYAACQELNELSNT